MNTDPLMDLSNGAAFFRADLHIHSFGGSYDVNDAGATVEAIVNKAETEGLSMIAITDHNEICNIRSAVEFGTSKGVVVIPGVELSTPEGHLLCYLPSCDSLDRFFGRVQIVGRKTPQSHCQTGTVQCLDLLDDEGGFGVLAHIDRPGAFEANQSRMTPAKQDIICHRALEGIEVSQVSCAFHYNADEQDAERRGVSLERIKRLNRGSSQFLARILNSDAHTLKAVGRNAKNDQRITRYKMEKPNYEGLLIAMRSADTRVRVEESIPKTVPVIHGVQFQGGFLDAEAIRFSPNLTCIIGGRGSGKSTAFESLCLIGGPPSEEIKVIDSDVWPETLNLAYRDETGHIHNLARSTYGEVENVDDPFTGSSVFPIDSYRQGATNEISKKVHDDPLALLTFLDRLIQIEPAIEEENRIRTELMDMAPKLAAARAHVAKIPVLEKDVKLKEGQLKRYRDNNGEEVIKLQVQLDGEKRTRSTIERQLAELSDAITDEAIISIADRIQESLAEQDIQLGAPEATAIQEETNNYIRDVGGATKTLQQVTIAYAAKVKTQVASWKAKESQTSAQIEVKRQELLKHNIRLDMPSIQKLISDDLRARENLRVAKGWVPELSKLQTQHAALLAQLKTQRGTVSGIRTAFAKKASEAMGAAVSDLFVSLKYEENALAPEAERSIIDAMGWRTLQHIKGRTLISSLTLPVLLDCVRRKDPGPITALHSDELVTVFQRSEADELLERLSNPELLSELEAAAIHDRPKLTVTKRLSGDAKPRYLNREFRNLSLGQQQSVLLALMLTSESTAPLVIDQPEDNLDSEFIYKTLVPAIRQAKERRQVIIVTHNANIAVLGDAELIVALGGNAERSKVVTRGSIDNQDSRESACRILEGSREAFERRALIYGVSKPT